MRVSKMGKTGYYLSTTGKNKKPYFIWVSAIGLVYIMTIIGTFYYIPGRSQQYRGEGLSMI